MDNRILVATCTTEEAFQAVVDTSFATEASPVVAYMVKEAYLATASSLVTNPAIGTCLVVAASSSVLPFAAGSSILYSSPYFSEHPQGARPSNSYF